MGEKANNIIWYFSCGFLHYITVHIQGAFLLYTPDNTVVQHLSCPAERRTRHPRSLRLVPEWRGDPMPSSQDHPGSSSDGSTQLSLDPPKKKQPTDLRFGAWALENEATF